MCTLALGTGVKALAPHVSSISSTNLANVHNLSAAARHYCVRARSRTHPQGIRLRRDFVVIDLLQQPDEHP